VAWRGSCVGSEGVLARAVAETRLRVRGFETRFRVLEVCEQRQRAVDSGGRGGWRVWRKL
jgi:hypothetical protein